MYMGVNWTSQLDTCCFNVTIIHITVSNFLAADKNNENPPYNFRLSPAPSKIDSEIWGSMYRGRENI